MAEPNYKVSAITCSYVPETHFQFSKLNDKVCQVLEKALQSGELALSEKLTKKKTQLSLLLPDFTLDSKQVYFRVRHQAFSRGGRTFSNFQNQLCFYYKTCDDKTKCFKVFSNGNVHVTGYADEQHMDTSVIGFLSTIVRWTEHPQPIQYTLDNVKKTVHMMNACFKLGRELSLVTLLNFLRRSMRNWDSMYEPELYSGLMLRADNFKANIFKSGSIIITGTRSLQGIQVAHSALLSFFETFV